jgi:hypothetical protein
MPWAGGLMAAATVALAERVRKGERLVLMCWCWPKPCHGNLIIVEINQLSLRRCASELSSNAIARSSRTICFSTRRRITVIV